MARPFFVTATAAQPPQGRGEATVVGTTILTDDHTYPTADEEWFSHGGGQWRKGVLGEFMPKRGDVRVEMITEQGEHLCLYYRDADA